MSKVDWTKAPKDSQFYSCGLFRKIEDGKEFFWLGWECRQGVFNDLDWHKESKDFEMRPEDTEPDWIKWEGKTDKCPVPKGHDVEVGFRLGGVERDCTPEEWNWYNAEDNHSLRDIVIYRDWTAFYKSKDKPASVSELGIEEQIQNIKEAHAHLDKLMELLLSSLPINKH